MTLLVSGKSDSDSAQKVAGSHVVAARILSSKSKEIGNVQELIQSNPTSYPQIQKGEKEHTQRLIICCCIVV